MHKAVRLTSDAVMSKGGKTVLSLSCYGSMCSPGQEYAGKYPSPHGPPSSASEAALVEWHYERMLVFASDRQIWSSIDMVAIETLPLLSEGIAARKAMYKLRRTLQDRGEIHWPAWWASFVFPDGQCPGDSSITPEQIARSMLEPLDKAEIPTGLGINCTKLRYLPNVLDGYTEAVKAAEPKTAPWLVIYPDGGLVYDVKTRTWHTDGSGPDSLQNADPAEVWAKQLYTLTQSALGEKRDDGVPIWGNAVIGGCCKASPAYISELSKVVKANKVLKA